VITEAAAVVPVVRGGLLGLVLGDAVGAAGGLPPRGDLPATPSGQLACFTVDGIIRAGVREIQRGFSSAPSVIWRAYQRWAVGQGIEQWNHASPDGWLAGVPELRVPRGSADATVAALRGQTMGTVGSPATTSVEADVLVRSLPAALAGWWLSDVVGLTRTIAATTHATAAADAAALGAALVARLARGAGLAEAVRLAGQDRAAAHVASPVDGPLAAALDAAAARPADAGRLRELAPDGSAEGALAGAVYVAASFREPVRLLDALVFAAGAGGHVAATAGTLLGAARGVDALPVDVLARAELAEVMDALAQDLVRQFTEHPSTYGRGTVSDWGRRYPGG